MNKKARINTKNGDIINGAEIRLMHGKIDRRTFMKIALGAGATASLAATAAKKAMAIQVNQASQLKILREEYDYIICGAGSSGCVVARRLAENPNVSVLLIEAGETYDVESDHISNPSWWSTNLGSDQDWKFVNEPSKAVNGRALPLPTGKMLGGSSSINAMAYFRGHKSDFDYWASEAGDDSWNYENVLRIYRKIEDWQGADDPKHRGKGGLFYVQSAPNPNPIAPAMVEAAASIGIPSYEDHNGEMMEGPGGCSIANVAIKDGRRQTVFMNYLQPILDQSNITVLTSTEVQKIMFEGTKATGVQAEREGSMLTFRATREVILSMGAINTPQILMVSGVGDEEILNKFDIPVIHHQPNIGKNFRDHVLIAGCIFEYVTPQETRNNFVECSLFWKSDPSLASPDLQPFQAEVPFPSEVTSTQYDVPLDSWTILPGLVQPHSHGVVTIRSSDPRVAPVLNANYLSDSRDVAACVRAVELCREIGNSAALRPFVKREVMPGTLKGPRLVEFIRNATTTYFHPACTCRMGRDSGAVVDSDLRVNGLDNLRIADASIMPRISTGNTMMPCVIIGERMGEILST